MRDHWSDYNAPQMRRDFWTDMRPLIWVALVTLLVAGGLAVML